MHACAKCRGITWRVFALCEFDFDFSSNSSSTRIHVMPRFVSYSPPFYTVIGRERERHTERKSIQFNCTSTHTNTFSLHLCVRVEMCSIWQFVRSRQNSISNAFNATYDPYDNSLSDTQRKGIDWKSECRSCRTKMKRETELSRPTFRCEHAKWKTSKNYHKTVESWF